jgi:lipid II:glycine glycyltransferase (peptidoglycan interpeptide bridge formation enzyme)
VTPVYTIDPLVDPRWAEFVERHPRASLFHTPGWLEALRRTYGYEPTVYTTTRPGVELTNGVVLCRVSSQITGRRLVSLPFSDHCEPLVERREDLEGLLDTLKLECAQEGWRYIEIRPGTATGVPPAGMEPAQVFSFHTLDLRPGLEEIFRRFHKDCTRRKIRRAERESLTYEEGRSQAIIEKFYRLLLRTRRRHQLPPHPRAWFSNLVDCLGEQVKIHVASKDGQPIASIFTHASHGLLTYKYGCSDQRFHNLGGMHLLFWRAIQDGKTNGARGFDLGRSDTDNSGLITFKDRWGAVRSQLTYWRYRAPVAASGRRTKVRKRIFPYIPDNLLTAAWRTKVARRLASHIPDRLLIAVGKLLYRHIG